MNNLNIIDNYCRHNRCFIQGVKINPIGIQIHSIGCAQGTAKAVADYWNSASASALVHYIVDSDEPGKVLRTLPENYYSWADAGFGNRNLITMELCESDFMRYISGASYEITNDFKFKEDITRSYQTAVLLCADICRRYGWDPLTKLSNGLYLISSHNEGRLNGTSSAHVDPSHIWPKIGKTMDDFRSDVLEVLAENKPFDILPTSNEWFRVRKTWEDYASQLGAYTIKANAIEACPYGYRVYDNDGKLVYQNLTQGTGTNAIEFATLSESVAADRILDLIRKSDDSGILYSVTAAQLILESGYLKTALAQTANNAFGMKVNLSGNTWPNSTWDGKSKVQILTREVYDGKDVQIYDDFRKYPCIEDSVKDHAAYLLGAMNGEKKRYEGLLDAKDYVTAITIIKNGGYATDPSYVTKLVKIIQRFGLDKYDGEKVEKPAETVNEEDIYYRVQVGRYGSLMLAKAWAATVKELTDFDTFLEDQGEDYQIVCGSFKDAEKARVRVHKLIDIFGIDAFVVPFDNSKSKKFPGRIF